MASLCHCNRQVSRYYAHGIEAHLPFLRKGKVMPASQGNDTLEMLDYFLVRFALSDARFARYLRIDET